MLPPNGPKGARTLQKAGHVLFAHRTTAMQPDLIGMVERRLELWYAEDRDLCGCREWREGSRVAPPRHSTYGAGRPVGSSSPARRRLRMRRAPSPSRKCRRGCPPLQPESRSCSACWCKPRGCKPHQHAFAKRELRISNEVCVPGRVEVSHPRRHDLDCAPSHGRDGQLQRWTAINHS